MQLQAWKADFRHFKLQRQKKNAVWDQHAAFRIFRGKKKTFSFNSKHGTAIFMKFVLETAQIHENWCINTIIINMPVIFEQNKTH